MRVRGIKQDQLLVLTHDEVFAMQVLLRQTDRDIEKLLKRMTAPQRADAEKTRELYRTISTKLEPEGK